MLDKTEIRAAMKSRRKALTPAERAAASEIICAKLAADSDIGLRVDPFEWGSPIAVYLASSQEIDLSPFIRKTLEKGVKVAKFAKVREKVSQDNTEIEIEIESL